MILTIENIGLIDKASIRLDGLTVIGGENDTGKSTAGKLMFAITKALSRYNDDFAISKESVIDIIARDIYFTLRRLSLDTEKYRADFLPKQFESAFNYVNNPNSSFAKGFDIDAFFEKRITFIKDEKEIIPQSVKNQIINNLEKIQKEIQKVENRSDLIQEALKRALISEFHFEISPNDKPSIITITDKGVLLLKIDIQDNKIKNVEAGDLFNFEDVTFIESPLVLQLSELISYADTFFEVISDDINVRLNTLSRPTIPMRFKDLMNKLQKSQRANHVNFSKSISDTIDGIFEYDKQNQDFIFKRRDGEQLLEVKSINTASGIKSFGIIQLLLQSGFIDERTLLIIDEPETHLHPKWQVEYAKLMVELVKNNYNVLLTSHSPYMIQALRVLSEKEEINDKTAFYLAERVNGKSKFEDVSTDIGKLFKKLAEPLNQLLWQ